jgi:hypothetical protein
MLTKFKQITAVYSEKYKDHVNILHMSKSVNTFYMSKSVNLSYMSKSVNTVYLSKSVNTFYMSNSVNTLYMSNSEFRNVKSSLHMVATVVEKFNRINMN